MMRKIIKCIHAVQLAIIILFTFSFIATTKATEHERQPNVVFVLIDDVGPAWISPYAKRINKSDIESEIIKEFEKRQKKFTVDVDKHIEAATQAMPFVDKLAGEGMVFDRCFTTASLCAPSRAGILTGVYQQKWGAYGNNDIDQRVGIPEEVTCLAENFDQSGYRTAMIGKWHVGLKDESLRGTKEMQDEKKRNDWKANRLGYETSCAKGHSPMDRGFDYYFGYNSSGSRYYGTNDLWEGNEHVSQRPEGEFLTDLFSEKARQFVSEALEKEEPFFLYYAPMTMHGRLDPSPEKYSSKFNTGVPFTNSYAGHLLALDEGIESIFQLIEENGQADNTIFVLCADNGAPNGVPPYNAPYKGGKGTGWLGGNHTPLIMWYPKGIKKGVTDELVSTTDILPTALDYAGISWNNNIDGKSLKRFLEGKSPSGPRDRIFAMGLHSTRWSYCYFGQKNKKDSDECPLYAWELNKSNEVMLFITETKKGLYSEFPEGRPAVINLFDLNMDIKQQQSVLDKYIKKGEALSREIKEWIESCKLPLEDHQDDYRRLIEMSKSVGKF